jgi:ATP-binding cassette subfamily E protein 1
MLNHGKVKPNLGRFGPDAPDWEEILRHFRGSELQNYFTKLLEDNLTAVIKPQYVDIIPRAVKGTVIGILDAKEEMDNKKLLIEMLDLKNVLDRDIALLSGGELQRFAIAVASIRKADMYVKYLYLMFPATCLMNPRVILMSSRD